MIREERDPAFWERIADHPAVCKVKYGQDFSIAAIVESERVLPLASEHGGFILVQLDAFGHIYELHTLYTPEGWGKEVAAAKKEAMERVFQTADLLTTFQTEDSQSRPPLSFGWRPAGEHKPNSIGLMRLWTLTKEAWQASPAGRRICR